MSDPRDASKLSLPVTLVISAAVGLIPALVVAVETRDAVATHAKRLDVLEVKVDGTSDRLTRLEANSEYTLRTVNEVRADVKTLLESGVRTVGARVPR
jgi:hypothetical protein